MRQKTDYYQKYYFSEKLKKQLSKMAYFPLTIVEAPSGFGKTTAVREWLKENLSDDARQYWYTCLGESPATAWTDVCELLANVSPGAAENLKSLNIPTIDSLFYLQTCLRDISCESETYLVVDNYHLVNCYVPRELTSVFSMHGNSRLHVIFITQHLESKQQFFLYSDNIHTIETASLFFDKKDTAKLFAMEGIRLSGGELENIYSSTEGWISALRLQMIQYKETGSFEFHADIEELVETVIWKGLAPEEREFLLSISVLESFTARQAAIMLNREVIPQKIEELLKNNDFIRYIPDKHQYSIHSILRDYLQNRLYYFESEEYQNQVLQKAGNACAAMGYYYLAAGFYHQINDFEAILSLPFTCEYLGRAREEYGCGILKQIIGMCPDEVLLRHPDTMRVFCYQAVFCGDYKLYSRLCGLVETAIKRGEGFTKEGLCNIRVEYMLLMLSLREFNDLKKIGQVQQAACELLKKPSVILKPGVPWAFATPSVLYMFWSKSGELEQEIMLMDKLMPTYYKLTDGHGCGSHILMRAEALLMRGEEAEAEILCYKALYDAYSRGQVSICISAQLTLARIAVLQQNTEGFLAAVNNIQDHARESQDLSIRRMAEHCMSILGIMLDIKEYIAPWIFQVEEIEKSVDYPVIPIAKTLYIQTLLNEKRYGEFYGICQAALEQTQSETENMHFMMYEVCLLLLLAIAKRNNGEHDKAQSYLEEALAIALPDSVYLPFAQYGCMEEFLTEANVRMHREDGSLNPADEKLSALRELCKRQKKGMEKIRKAVLADKSPLTPREREIAKLAKGRLSAKEIAGLLCISEMTVRATLRNVYSKLEIHSKNDLIRTEF